LLSSERQGSFPARGGPGQGPRSGRAAAMGETIFPGAPGVRSGGPSSVRREKWWGPVVLEAARPAPDDGGVRADVPRSSTGAAALLYAPRRTTAAVEPSSSARFS